MRSNSEDFLTEIDRDKTRVSEGLCSCVRPARCAAHLLHAAHQDGLLQIHKEEARRRAAPLTARAGEERHARLRARGLGHTSVTEDGGALVTDVWPT